MTYEQFMADCDNLPVESHPYHDAPGTPLYDDASDRPAHANSRRIRRSKGAKLIWHLQQHQGRWRLRLRTSGIYHP